MDEGTRKRIAAQIDPNFPAATDRVNRELIPMLANLYGPGLGTRLLALMLAAPGQELQWFYAKELMHVPQSDWNDAQRQTIVGWLVKAHGKSTYTTDFYKFISETHEKFIEGMDAKHRERLPKTLTGPLANRSEQRWDQTGRSFVRNWTAAELLGELKKANLPSRDLKKGRALFSGALCINCHRFKGSGSTVGPDLSSLAGRFSNQDLLEALIEPSKVISSQYQITVFTMNDGETVAGRVVNLSGGTIVVQTDLIDIHEKVVLERSKISNSEVFPVSLMPAGLLNTLNKDEILDLFAYLMSH